MTSEVIIDVQPKEISIALLEDKNLVEYQNEKREEASYSVGNIYLGKVRKLMPGLNACFVDVGSERDAFLHYLDLGTQFSSYEKYLKQVQSDKKNLYPIQKATRQPDLPKEGSITMLKQGQEILVQVVKEPINTKGPRLSCDISFAGRYMVLIPFKRGESTPEAARPKHPPQELRRYCTHFSRRQACGRAGQRVEEPAETLGRHDYEGPEGHQDTPAVLRRDWTRRSYDARPL